MITIKEWLVNVVQLNKINVVGLGPGNIKYLSNAGIDCIKEAEIVVGSTRQLSDLKTIISEKQEVYILGKLSELIAYLKENIERKITIIVSGDTGYYSLVPYLSKNLSKDILNIIPNISSYQYLFSNTIEEACDYIENNEIYHLIANRVAFKMQEYARADIEVSAAIFSFKGETIGESDNYQRMVGECGAIK